MHILAVDTQENAVLQDVVAATGTHFHLIVLHRLALMVPTSLHIEQQVVGSKDTALSLKAYVQFVLTAVVQVESRQRSAHIELVLLELCTCSQRQQRHYHHDK